MRVFQFVINFTPLDILLGIPNYDNSNVIMNLNFVILFAKYFIYDCKKNDKPVDFYHFQVKLKTRMIIEEYRSELYNRKLDFLVKWSVLSDSLCCKSVMGIILSCVWEEFLLLCVCIPYIFTAKTLMCLMCFMSWACVKNVFCVFCVCQEWMMWCILYKKKKKKS